MTYRILAVRSSADEQGGAMYPLIDGNRDLRLEPLDGSNITRVEGKALSSQRAVDGKLQRITGANVDCELYITDARVAVRCLHYDKVHWDGQANWDLVTMGGGMALTDLAIRKVYHAAKTRHKALVGHLRYPWIRDVGFQADEARKGGLGLRFRVTVGTPTQSEDLYLTVQLRSGDAEALAREAAMRVARYRLAHAKLDEVRRILTERLLGVEPLAPIPGQVAWYRIPTFSFAGPNTAFPRQ